MHRLLLLLICLSSPLLCAQQSSPVIISPQGADTWAATDALGRSLPGNAETGDLQSGKYVGIFYFAWLGVHGHDEHSSPPEDEGVWPKDDDKAYTGPYDISQILRANPNNPKYGPDLAFHHWGQPYFGYYLSDDEWVIVKHAQLLSDAGVDVVVFDVTNGPAYLPIALKVCTIFSRLQQMGWAVPKVSFLTNTAHVETTKKVYDGFYKQNHYPELWFHWKGKPLFMGNPEGLSDEITGFFNFRRSWAWTKDGGWFGDGKDKWPWIDHYPQKYGWHDNPETPEQIVVSTAQHPISNIGRSYSNGVQPPPDKIDSGAGIFFAEQWKRALEVDPEFIFITGWNEWVAMRFTDGRAKKIMGKPIVKGETFFVDQYNEEFSRDIEPMKGGFGDNYYYQMVDGIRRFKGARALRKAQQGPRTQVPRDAIKSEVSSNGITLDGSFADWHTVNSIYYDHAGDVLHRNSTAWGRLPNYVDTTGRYDLLEARVAQNDEVLSFYLRVNRDFTGGKLPDGMDLLISVGDESSSRNIGYTHRLQPGEPTVNIAGDDRRVMKLATAQGNWKWKPSGGVPVSVSGNELEFKIPLSLLDNPTGELQFKWIDNVHPNGDALRFMSHGDSAPNARFNYRFQLTGE